jgi:ADP-ribose pyrophosphatase YjhB (NUDIX family)
VREENGEPVLACTGDGCQFIDWNNPVPVVAALIVAPARAESGPSTSAVSGSGDRVVLVKRGVEPFVGRWCLPRGFLKTDENPKGAVVREVEEETGLRILLKRMLNACNPSPANYPLNQITMFYLATIAGGVLGSGDDAAEVGLFGRDELPDICFDSDTQLIADWFAGVHGQVEAPVNYAPPSSSSQVVSVIPATGCGSKS